MYMQIHFLNSFFFQYQYHGCFTQYKLMWYIAFLKPLIASTAIFCHSLSLWSTQTVSVVDLIKPWVTPGVRGHSAAHCSSLFHTDHRYWASTTGQQLHIPPLKAPKRNTRDNFSKYLILFWFVFVCTHFVAAIKSVYLGVMELHRVISGQRNTQAFL